MKYIWFSGKPAAIPETQIDALKLILSEEPGIDCVSAGLLKGTRVKVKSGPLRGLTGELVNYAGKRKVMLRIEHIDKALLLTISPHLLEPIMIN